MHLRVEFISVPTNAKHFLGVLWAKVKNNKLFCYSQIFNKAIRKNCDCRNICITDIVDDFPSYGQMGPSASGLPEGMAL